MSGYVFVVVPHSAERNRGISVFPADEMGPVPARCNHSGYRHGKLNFSEYARANGKRKKIFEQHRPPHPAHRRGCWFASRGGHCIKPSGMRGSGLPELARTVRPLPVVVVWIRGTYPLELEAIAKILSVCRLGDEPRSPAGDQSQRFLALGIDIKDFLKIEDVAEALVRPSRNAKEFLDP